MLLGVIIYIYNVIWCCCRSHKSGATAKFHSCVIFKGRLETKRKLLYYFSEIFHYINRHITRCSRDPEVLFLKTDIILLLSLVVWATIFFRFQVPAI